MLSSTFSQRFTFILTLGLSLGLLLSPSESHPDSPHTPQNTHDVPGGFRPGSKPFQNPFANGGTDSAGHPMAADPFFDDDDDDDDDFSPNNSRGNPPGNPHGSPQGNVHGDHLLPQHLPTRVAPHNVSQSSGNAISRDIKIEPAKVDSKPKDLTTTAISPAAKAKFLRIDNHTGLGDGSKEVITDFNFPDADILDIAKTLGKLTGKNFIYDNKEVKGRITIISNGPIDVSTAWRAFLTALDATGFAIVESGNYLRIIRSRDAKDKQLTTYTGDTAPNTDALIIRVFQLKYISPDEVAKTFRNLMPPSARIVAYDATNSVIVTDTGANISKMAKMLQLLDVEGFDAGIEVIPVKFASAAELQKLIDSLLPGTSTMGANSSRAGGGGGKFSSRRTKEGGIINTIIADDRTNSLIVHANAKGADQVRELVTKLDHKYPSPAGGGRIHVVYLEFADAEQLASTLNNFSQQSSSTRTSTSSTNGIGINPMSQTLFESTVKISPDKATNSLVINASPSDFVTIQRVINRLDVPRNQVFVEVVIMEVAVSNSFSFSSNIINGPSGLGSVTNSQDLSAAQQAIPFSSNGALAIFSAGQSTPVNINGQIVNVSSVMAFLKLLQSNSETNILATPQVLALDNSEALFETSDKIPTSTGQTITATGFGQQQITKEPVILSIKIKPQINKVTNFVKLDITAKLSDINNGNVPAKLQGMTFETQERTAQTAVVVADHDTIVLGGLMRDTISDTVVKVPILGDIPLLGWLFKSRSSSVQKRNLLIFMTPHIINQYEKLRPILDKRLSERDRFIENNAGGNDPLRYQRDELIRSLPDIDEIIKQRSQHVFNIDEERAAKTHGNLSGKGPQNSAVGSIAKPDSENPHSDALAPNSPGINPEDRIPVSGGSQEAQAVDAPPQNSASGSGNEVQVPNTVSDQPPNYQLQLPEPGQPPASDNNGGGGQ